MVKVCCNACISLSSLRLTEKRKNFLSSSEYFLSLSPAFTLISQHFLKHWPGLYKVSNIDLISSLSRSNNYFPASVHDSPFITAALCIGYSYPISYFPCTVSVVVPYLVPYNVGMTKSFFLRNTVVFIAVYIKKIS